MNTIRAIGATAALTVSLGAGVGTGVAHASLQEQMDSMFDSMSNVTNPTAVMGQRRGLLAGGRYSLRSDVMSVEVLSILPPSAAAGCNGIDMFGGSFSFISADQFIQLLRSIAANASGYAFKMALQAMCPSCDAVMSKLQGLIQKMNSLSVNSCQAAKELVAGAASLTPEVVKTGVSNAAAPIATSIGAATDAVSSLFPSIGDGGTALGKTAATSAGRQELEEDQVIGNVVWMALKKANAAAWWPDGDTALMEAVMSVTGSVIIHPPADENGAPGITPLPPILNIEDFMAGAATGGGNEVRVYKCLNDSCYIPDNPPGVVSNPAIVTLSVESFSDQVSTMVLAVVSKFVDNAPLTSEEASFMASAPAAVGGMVRNLARMHPGMALLYANKAAPTIAQMMASDLVLSMAKAAHMAIATSTSPAAVQVRSDIQDVTQSLRAQAASIRGNLASLQSLIDTYNGLRNSAVQRRLGIGSLVQDMRPAIQ